ncbi:hypothetical protein BH11ACT4_BH11ACT4_18020 [soil metagenome]
MSARIPVRIGALFALVFASLLVTAGGALAEDSTTVDFTAFDAAQAHAPAGQHGWTGFSATSYDWGIVDNSAFSSGLDPAGRSLRFSNWITVVGQYGNIKELISPPIEPAGEPIPNATGNPVNNTFETTFRLASATGAYQEALSLSVAVDNGDGGRGGGVVGFVHTPAGLQFITAGIAPGADWTTQYSGYFDVKVPHTLRIVSTYVTDGPDVLDLYVDGASTPALSGATYEGYHRAASSPAGAYWSAALLFRANRITPKAPGSYPGLTAGTDPTGPQLAALKGKGFLISDVSYRTYNRVPAAPPVVPASPPAASMGTELELSATTISPDSAVDAVATGMVPGELVGFSAYSTPAFLGYAIANASGVATLRFTPPAALDIGAHRIVATGVASGNIATSGFTILALAATGTDVGPSLGIGLGALGIGVLFLTLARRVSRGRHS